MPNAKVRLSSAFMGGVIAGTMYQLVQWGYIHFQIGVSKYGAIYGSFAALPLFLLWLQISWLVVLYGAEVAFAHQNEATYEFEPDCKRASRQARKTLALKICQFIFKRFDQNELPLKGVEISQQLDIPIRLVNDTLYELVQAGILNEVKDEASKSHTYQPAHSIEHLTVQAVLEALEESGDNNLSFLRTQEFDGLRKCVGDLTENARLSEGNKVLKDTD